MPHIRYLHAGFAHVIALLIAVASLPATTSSTRAAPHETGIHQIHAAARVGKKWCFVEHAHVGDSEAFPSRRVAEAAAIRKWVMFTVDEYGTAWGNYGAAVAKSMTCHQSSDSYWRCTAQARPCKAAK